MFTAAPVKTSLPANYLERRRRLQRLHNQVEERTITPAPAPRVVKSLERFLASLANALPQNNSVIEDIIVRGDMLEVRYSVEEPSERLSLEDSAVALTKVGILRLDNGNVMERWDTVYQVKTLPLD